MYKDTKRLLWSVLILNWLVALAKISYGLASSCASMTADGFHSLSDGASNIIGLIGIHFASKPLDEDHPYGHKKYETFFSLAIAAMLLFVCFNIVKGGINHLRHPLTPRVNIQSFVIMLITMAINIGVMRCEFKKGTAIGSDILIADALHTKADIFTSASVIVTLIAIKLGIAIVDTFASFVIALFIARSAFFIIKRSSDILCDTAAILDVDKITAIVLAVKGVKACHKIRSRGRADDIHLDLHVQVNPDMHIDNAHKVSYTIEEAIKKQIPTVTDVLVHLEPK